MGDLMGRLGGVCGGVCGGGLGGQWVEAVLALAAADDGRDACGAMLGCGGRWWWRMVEEI